MCLVGFLVPWPGMELKAPEEEAWNLNHWTTRKVLKKDALASVVSLLLFWKGINLLNNEQSESRSVVSDS